MISPTAGTSNEKPRFICEKLERRETDKRQKVRESDQTSLLIKQVFKEVQGSSAPASKTRAPVLPDGKFGALELHRSTPGFYFARIRISVRALSRERNQVPGSTTKISGLQHPKALPLDPD